MLTRLVTLLILILTACSPRLIQVPDLAQITTLTPSQTTTQPYNILTQGDVPQMTPSGKASFSELQKLIDVSKMDLSQRLSTPVSEIKLVSAQEVIWSDTSLGCPQEGGMYAQVERAGYLIHLEANTQVYDYHMDEEGIFVLCKFELDDNGFQKDKSVEDGWPSQPKDTEIIKLTPTKNP